MKNFLITLTQKHLTCNTPPWVFYTFFKLYKWYQITQRTTYVLSLTHFFAKNMFVKGEFFDTQNSESLKTPTVLLSLKAR